MTQRTVDQHMKLFAAYGEAIGALSPDAWQRLRETCAPLEGDAFAMVVRRARFAARAHDVFEPFSESGRARLIAGSHRATITGIGVVSELVSEFWSPSALAPTRVPPVESPRHALFAKGWFAMEQGLLSAIPTPGLAVAVRTAGQAVLRHDWLAPATFAEIYSYVEAEVPYATVERDAGEG